MHLSDWLVVFLGPPLLIGAWCLPSILEWARHRYVDREIKKLRKEMRERGADGG